MARATGAVALMAAAALICALCAPDPAAARDALVYWPLVTNGTEVRRVPYPPQAGPILALAGTDLIIEARLAPVSYWPITREYLADFSQNPEPVAGRVEIVDEAGTVTVVEREPYVLWYPAGVGAGASALVRGGGAIEFHARYVKTARAAAEAARQYQRLVAEQNAAVEAWLKMAAQRPENLPKPPPELKLAEPEPYQAHASEPREAAIVALAQGTYTVRIRGADGEIVPGSERLVVSFGVRDRAIGYVLRPENRWTRPVVSFAPDQDIYTTGGTDLFLQPVPVVEYEARRFTRLLRPQSVEVSDPALTMWVPAQVSEAPDGGAAVALWDGGDLVASLPGTAYRVAQVRGTARGYTIEEFAPESGLPLKPDFRAMRVAADTPATRLGYLKRDGAAPEPGSERRLRKPDPLPEPLLFLPALLPLALGLALRLRARGAARRTQSPAGDA